MNEADLYCAVCGQYSGEGSMICPDCQADSRKLAGYIVGQRRYVIPAERIYKQYRTDQMSRYLHRQFISGRR